MLSTTTCIHCLVFMLCWYKKYVGYDNYVKYVSVLNQGNKFQRQYSFIFTVTLPRLPLSERAIICFLLYLCWNFLVDDIFYHSFNCWNSYCKRIVLRNVRFTFVILSGYWGWDSSYIIFEFWNIILLSEIFVLFLY